MARTFWRLGCGFGFVAVAAGAFGAHALRARLPADLLAVFKTAARYQMYHALALLAVALVAARAPSSMAAAAGWLFCAGIVLFSGSLYALALKRSIKPALRRSCSPSRRRWVCRIIINPSAGFSICSSRYSRTKFLIHSRACSG